MNNYERIKSMTVDEMALFFKETFPMDNCLTCVGCPEDEMEINCKKYIKQWLLSEVEDE